MKQNKTFSEKDTVNLLRYASHDLPALKNKIQKLTSNVIDLEWKKNDLKDTTILCNTQIRDLGQTIIQYQNAIENRKQHPMRMDKRISELRGIDKDCE